MKKLSTFFRHWFEAAFWLLALVALYFMPLSGDHYSLCIYSQLGFSWCPGCGIGSAIHHLLHFEWQLSWQEHKLAAPAVVIIAFRTFRLLKHLISSHEQPKAFHAHSGPHRR